MTWKLKRKKELEETYNKQMGNCGTVETMKQIQKMR